MERNKRSFLIKPLSFTKYLINNKRRTISMITALTVSVVMIVIFQMISHVVLESGRFAINNRLERITVVYPGQKGKVSDDVLEKIKGSPYVDKLIPMYVETTDYYHFFGNLNIPVYFIGQEDMQNALSALGLQLKEGRLPEPGKNEILLDWRTANNKGKKAGDFIGREVESTERMPGKYQITGILEGDCLVGLHPVQSDRLFLSNGMLVLPKLGDLERFNLEFSQIPQEDAIFSTKEFAEKSLKDTKKTLGTLTGIVSIAILSVMAFAAGNSSYAQYFSRRFEFGILQSIGYTKAQILLRASKEIAVTNLAGTGAGLGLSFIIGAAVLRAYFESKGYPFVMLNAQGAVQVIVVPLCTAVFSLIPSGWLLAKVDPMMIIEKFE